MSDRCALVINREDITGVDDSEFARPCLRPEGHDGPHLITDVYGKYIIWEDDQCDPGECHACDSEDSADNCLVFGTVTKDEAEILMVSTKYP